MILFTFLSTLIAFWIWLWLETRGSNRVGFCHRCCAHTVLQTVPIPGVCSAVYGTVHYKEPLKSFDKSRAWSRLLAVFCRDIA